MRNYANTSRTVQRNLIFILFEMFFENLVFILPSFQQLLLKKMWVILLKMAFIENEAVLLCVTMPECARAFAATSQCVTF